MGRNITIEGLAELDAKLRQLPKDLESAAEVANKEAAKSVYDDMRANAPRASGLLDGAIGQRQTGPLSMEVGILGARRAWWGALVEFGTIDRPATPFAEPAARAEEARYPARMAKAINSRLPS